MSQLSNSLGGGGGPTPAVWPPSRAFCTWAGLRVARRPFSSHLAAPQRPPALQPGRATRGNGRLAPQGPAHRHGAAHRGG